MFSTMNPRTVLRLLIALVAGSWVLGEAASATPRNFLSPLTFTGTEWRVRSDVGPVYLARWESGAWRIVACFDGSKGNYVLSWVKPYAGVYAAIDPSGTSSEVVQIGGRRGP